MGNSLLQNIRFEIEVLSQDVTFDVATRGRQDIRLEVEGMYKQEASRLTEGSATPTQSTQVITPPTGYNGFSKFTVNPIPSNYGLITYNGSVLTVS